MSFSYFCVRGSNFAGIGDTHTESVPSLQRVKTETAKVKALLGLGLKVLPIDGPFDIHLFLGPSNPGEHLNERVWSGQLFFLLPSANPCEVSFVCCRLSKRRKDSLFFFPPRTKARWPRGS